MKAIQAVLFDLGNTLTRSASLSRSILGIADTPIVQNLNLSRNQLNRIGIEVNQYISNLYREERLDQPDWYHVWKQGVKNAGLEISHDEIEILCRAHLTEFEKQCELEPNSIPLLNYIRKANIPLGLVSNVTGPVDIFDKNLSEKGLSHFFQVIVWSSAVGYRKPNPKIFEIALDGLKLKPGKHIIMVGDNEKADIIGSRKMGFTTIKVEGSKSESESVADYVVSRSELRDFFKNELIM